mgnify:CR=1 FL=1
MRIFISLKQRLLDELKVKKIMTVDEIINFAESLGYKASNAERRLRKEHENDFLPIKKLDRYKKPINGSKRIYFYSWKGAQTSFKPYGSPTRKIPLRTKQEA